MRDDAAQPETFEPIERRKVALDAVEQVMNLVARGALQPGQRLPPERVLADQLGVSRPTLREAICALTVLGVLDVTPGAGTYVSRLTPEVLARPLRFMIEANPGSLRELFEFRLQLEVGAAEVAATRINATDIRRLKKTIVDL